MHKQPKVSNKVLVFRLIFWLSLIGLVFPFAAEVILPFFFEESKISGIEIWNQYVSLILGLVATIMSVISLSLCFKSEEQSNKATQETKKVLAQMTEKLKSLGKQQDRIENMVSRNTFPSEQNSVTATEVGVVNDEVTP